MKLRILGCGTSTGVPRIGGDWGLCDPSNPRNRRSRASILVEADGYVILVDTGPDMREQLLAAECGKVDAVIYTHDHADHCHGIDDLRQLFHVSGRPVDIYARQDTLDTLHARFTYAFTGKNGYPPTVSGHLLPDDFRLGPMRVRVTDLPHGNITSAALRFDWQGRSMAYSTDFHAMTNEAMALFEGLDLWVVDALRRRPHATHPYLMQALEWIEQLSPGQAVLTHMDQSMDYATLAAELPPGVEPGYDGLTVTLKRR